MVTLPEEIKEAFSHPDTVKTLTTVDEEGIPHTVIKDSKVLESGNIAYMELLGSSVTQRNMLRSLWWGKKLISLGIFNNKLKINFQIKAAPYKFWIHGDFWQQTLDEVWPKHPESDPEGVWELVPEEIRDQNFEVRMEETKQKNPTLWKVNHYFGPRPNLKLKMD